MARSKKFAGIDEQLAFKAGIAVAGYFLVVKPILQKVGIQKTTEEKKKENAIEKSREDVYANQDRTLTDVQIANYADVIHTSLNNVQIKSSFDSDHEKAGLYLCMVRNEADLYRLIELYGVRADTYLVFDTKRTLPQMVVNNLSSEKIAAINKNYLSKGIKYRW